MQNKIMQELMKEKLKHNIPLEKLLGEENKTNRHESINKVCFFF